MKKVAISFLIQLVVACVALHAQMPTVSTDVSPLLVGETIPDATLINAQGQAVSVYSLTKDKPTIFVFYRGVWCSNCITNFREEYVPNLATITKDYNLVAICPDGPSSLKKAASDSGLDAKYFYGDGTGEFVKLMGLAFQQADRMKERLLESSDGKNTDLYLPVPAVYIVGTDNKVLLIDIRPTAIPSSQRVKWHELQYYLQIFK